MTTPSVSVVVTTFNQAPYIEAALRSVLEQTYTDYEIIVVDDGSTDNTQELLKSFGQHVEIVRQANAGVASSRNTGVLRARGRYVAFLDGDDLWHKDKLAVQVRSAAAHPEAGLIAVDGIQFEGEGTVLSQSLLSLSKIGSGGERCGDQLVVNTYMALLRSQIIATISQVMVPTSVLQTVGPSDPAFPRASDYDLYLRIARRYPFVLIQKSLVSWRYLATSASGPREHREITYLTELIAILKKAERTAAPSLQPVIKNLVNKRTRQAAGILCYHGHMTGNRWFAACELRKLLDKRPSSFWIFLFSVALWLPRPLYEKGKELHRAARFYSKPGSKRKDTTE